MIYTASGQKIKPVAGFVSGWCRVPDAKGEAYAVASQSTYQDWEPLESMEHRNETDSI